MKNTKCYSELVKLQTAKERYQYLRLAGSVGKATFGYDRYLNQAFYTSPEWRKFRNDMILRDNGCDMALPDREIPKGAKLILHHINPLTLEDVQEMGPALFDPENVVCVSDKTHNAIHYGDETLMTFEPVVRRPNDTCPWKQ